MDIKKKKKNTIQSRVLPSNITIDTYFCIVTDSNGVGDVTDSSLQKQIAVLNQNFANSGSRFRFQMKGAQRKTLRRSSTTDIPLLSYITSLTVACRQGGLDALNIFVVPFIESVGNGVVLGVCYSFFQTGVSYADGVYMLKSNLPGGGFFPVDLGITAVHEVGHWLGLIHTFQALPPYSSNPCDPANPNDYIADTPQMNSSSNSIKGCPVNRDSCPLDPGLDPTNNFMDYGYQYDASGNVCKTMFSAQQVARMQDVWDFYRVQNVICATNEFQFELQIQFDQNPQNTAWDIKFSNGTLLHQSITDGLGDAYNKYFAGQTISVYKCFPLDTTYIFDIYSASGNGIASPGYYRIDIDGKLLAQGGQDFKSVKSISFGVAAISSLAPTQKPTVAPTQKPTVPPTQKPTVPPTLVPTANSSPTAPTVAVKVPDGYCFSHADTVDAENRGKISVSELRIGDKVKSTDGTYVMVYSFGHYHSNASVEYLQIHAKGLQKPFEVSKDHLVFVQGSAVPASTIVIGDVLDSERGPTVVTKIRTVNRSGAYAPFTTSGTILVNGVASSCYITLQEESHVLTLGMYKTPFSMHWVAHIFQAPHRLVCWWSMSSCKSEKYTADGISKWVSSPLRCCLWLVRQNGILMTAVFLPALLIGLLFYFMEGCCLHFQLLVVAAFVATSALAPLVFFSRNGYSLKSKRKDF